MTLPSASKKMTDLHRAAVKLVEKSKNKEKWSDADCEMLAEGVANLALLVQDMLLETKRPTREMPVLPKRN